jgi:acyl-CoA synthetase (AMP-forming)/AMP-acid ligase II
MLILEVLDRHVAQRGDHPFIAHAGRRVSYRELDRLSNRAAHALRHLGVEKGDRVTLAMGNSIEYLVADFGILKAGGVIHPVNPALGAGELGYILKHASPRVIVASPEHVPQLLAANIVPAMSSVASWGAVPGAVDLRGLLEESSDAPVPVSLTPEDASTLLYTSGTTGDPKGVLFRHHSTGAAGQHFLDVLGITSEDTILAVTPLFHGNAWGAVVTALQAGATVAFPQTFRASEFWPLVHECQATVLYTLGTILAILLTQEPSDLERNNPLRIILGLGSAPIRDRIIARFGVSHVAECFGSTDAGVVTIEPPGAAPRPGSAGPPVPGVRLRIVDDAGHELPPGEVGEITISSPHRMAEYFRDPEQTSQALRDGWFLSGDLGYVDADGWLYFVDRKRDVIRRGGENISSVLVEKVLREHPLVLEAAVIGVPDPVLGQEVKAFIVARGPVSETELRDFAAARLARFQVPRLWELRDTLPKTATQRVEKYKLRQEHASTTRGLLG